MVDATNTVVALGLQQVGKPYVFDTPLSRFARNPRSFDCSGLTMWCYWHGLHYSLTHLAAAQKSHFGRRGSRHRPLSDAQPGDLIFYAPRGHGPAYHVAICAGSSELIEAPQPGTPVRVRSYSNADTDIVQWVGIMPGSDTSSPVFRDTVAGEVLSQTSDPHVQLAMLADPFWEGGGPDPLGAGPWGVGDNGVSFGPYQINTSAHPGVTKAEATNPHFAVQYMRPSYAAAANNVPQTEWIADPERAVEQTAYQAESPSVDYYRSHGSAAVHAAYEKAVQVQSNPATYKTPQGNTVPKPPYDPKTLSAPLTPTQRARMIAWMVKVEALGLVGTPPNPKGGFASLPDQILIDEYALFYAEVDVAPGPMTGPPNPLASLQGVISWLSNSSNWKRIGLFVLGAIIIIFAAIEGFKAT